VQTSGLLLGTVRDSTPFGRSSSLFTFHERLEALHEEVLPDAGDRSLPAVLALSSGVHDDSQARALTLRHEGEGVHHLEGPVVEDQRAAHDELLPGLRPADARMLQAVASLVEELQEAAAGSRLEDHGEGLVAEAVVPPGRDIAGERLERLGRRGIDEDFLLDDETTELDGACAPAGSEGDAEDQDLANEAPTAAAETRPRRRFMRALRRGTVALLVVFIGLYLTRNLVLGPLALGIVESEIDERFDCELSVEAIGGSWFGDLRLEGVNLRRRGGDFPVARCEDATLALHFSLLDLARGNVSGLHSVDLRAARLDILVPPATDDASSAPNTPVVFPALLPAIELSVTRLNVQLSDEETLAWRAFQLHVDPPASGPQTWNLAFDSDRERARLDGTYGDDRVTLEGALERDAVQAAVNVTVPLALELKSLLTDARARVVVTASQLTGLLPESERERFANAFESQLELDLEWDGKQLSASAGRLTAGTSRADLRSLQFVPGPDLAVPHIGGRLELAADVESTDLAPLGALFGTEDWSGGASGEITLQGPLDALRGRIELASSAAVIAGRALGETDIAVTLDGAALEIERFEARGELGTARASGGWDWKKGEFVGLQLEYDLPDATTLGLSAIEGGRAHFRATLDGPTTAPRGELQLTADEIVALGRTIEHFETRGKVLGWGELALDVLRLETREGSVHSSGRWVFYEGLGTLTLTELLATRGDEQLALARPLVARFGEWGAEVDPFELEGALGRVRGELSSTPDQTSFSLACEALDPMPLLAVALPLGVRLDGVNGTLSGIVGQELECALDLTIDAWSPDPEVPAWQLAARAQLANNQLIIERLAASQNELGHFTLSGRAGLDLRAEAPLVEGELELDLALEALDLAGWARTLGFPDVPLAGSATGSAELRGAWNALVGEVALAASNLTLALPGSPDAPLGPGSVHLDCTLGDAIELHAGSARFPGQASFDLTGRIATPVDLARVAQDARQAPLTLRCDAEVPDLAWVAGWSEGIRRTAGRLTCGLDVGGSLAAPTLDGTLVCEDGALRLSSSVPAIGALEARAEFDHERLHSLRVDAELGGAPFALTGEVAFSGGEPAVTLHIQGDDLLLQRGGGLKLRADTDVHVDGPLSTLRASGVITLTDGRFVRSIDLLGGVLSGGGGPTAGRGLDFSLAREGPLADLQLDIEVRSAEPFRLKNNLLDGALRPDLHIGGTGAVPLVLGPIYLEPTRVALPSGRLRLSSGTVLFREDDPFVPAVDINGSARIKGYDIAVHVTGDILEQEILVSSVPPLANDDLVVLLLTGQLPEGERSQAAGQAIAVYLAQDTFARWLADEDPDSTETLLDRIEIEMGGDVTRSGVTTSEISYRLSQRPRGPGVVRYLTGERDVYDKANLGYRFVFRFH